MFDDLLDDELEPLDDQAGTAVGIDLGTTNSVIAYSNGGKAQIFEPSQGQPLLPSVVAWMPNGELIVGNEAKRRKIIDPANTVYSVKRLIGQSYRAPAIQNAISQLPYKIVEGEQQEVMIETRAGRLSIPEISGHVVSNLTALAGDQLRMPITHCVITVPANFSDGQRAATKQAAHRAGLEVLRVLNEPTAAAVAYGRERPMHQRIAVFDLGGGTFDLTLLAVRGKLYEVMATGGDPFLGGDDFDHVVTERLRNDFLAMHRYDPMSNPNAIAKLRGAAEAIKHHLSKHLVVEGTIQEVAHGAGGEDLALPFRIERSDFEQLIAPIVNRAIQKATEVLAEAGVQPSQIDEVILVGGSTSVPLVQRRVAECFGKEGRSELNPMTVVAEGAALQAAGLFGGGTEAPVLFDVTPHSLRVATISGYSKVLVAKNTTLPAEGVSTFFTARDDQDAVRLSVCQGESDRFDENIELGSLDLSGFPVGRRGQVGIEVTFTIDANGILQVSAREPESGSMTQATLSTVGHREQR